MPVSTDLIALNFYFYVDLHMCFVGLFPLIKFPQTHSRTRADAKDKLICIASRRANISWAIRSSSGMMKFSDKIIFFSFETIWNHTILFL